ncbi:hypothetical protein FJV41_49705 [Myxococcus llanfairpwllgwyngyllgogerychwyrndrobwllllantysiliogogogochensis]|uniref:Uncharacterized protein n=1 Tax=Myxococcus llanfairpwllgwyngyllgogerychwyrndrobwllllantysiliogogogochensis TaxID=2590453 RepID=A0A540WHI4_9BACT|nr:hypothetical protein [Myxococcus llanfairpwllgwyngyllgogerychwyrndrobwllllantysiliogogogochensis]TQF08475.1 hypothetical protein FJV41_49705 [Myxococcus llanfairpwllgwyngyllgogerychwyrndrobwllllantysiliogogogochensis]
MIAQATRAAKVPPLRACALCMHRRPVAGALHCGAPAVRNVFGLQPVSAMRATAGACGPSAAHMDMPGWAS